MGRKAAAEKAESLIASAIAALAPYGGKADTLREAARFIISRKN
jgi:farnesyl diphosphate synthase